MTSTLTETDVVNRYYATLNAADWDSYDELFTPDAALEGFGGVTGNGPDAMRAFDQVWKLAAPDFTITVLTQANRNGLVIGEILAEGTHTALLRLPTGDVPATGLEVGGKGVGVFEVRDGRISAQRIYFDRMIIAEQLGLLPTA
jgi:ketosteroid isomerase-like protein